MISAAYRARQGERKAPPERGLKRGSVSIYCIAFSLGRFAAVLDYPGLMARDVADWLPLWLIILRSRVNSSRRDFPEAAHTIRTNAQIKARVSLEMKIHPKFVLHASGHLFQLRA